MQSNEPTEPESRRRLDLSQYAIVGGEAAAAAAVAATLPGGVGLVLGAAALPVFSHVLGSLIEKRANSFRKKLAEAGLTEQALSERILESPVLAELLQEATGAAMSTDLDEKQTLLARIIVSATLSDEEFHLALGRRIVAAVQRIDAGEVRILRALEGGAKTRSELVSHLPGNTADAIDSIAGVLHSEGTVVGDLDAGGLSLTGFGRRILQELRDGKRKSSPDQGVANAPSD